MFEFFKAKSKNIYIHGILIFFHTCKFEKSVSSFFITSCVQHPVYSKEKYLKKWVIIIVVAADRYIWYIYICIRKTPKNLANLAWLMYSKHCTVSATVRLNYITTMYYYYYPPDRKHVVNSLARLFKQYFSHPTTTACHRRALTANLRLFCCKYKCIMHM